MKNMEYGIWNKYIASEQLIILHLIFFGFMNHINTTHKKHITYHININTKFNFQLNTIQT